MDVSFRDMAHSEHVAEAAIGAAELALWKIGWNPIAERSVRMTEASKSACYSAPWMSWETSCSEAILCEG